MPSRSASSVLVATSKRCTAPSPKTPCLLPLQTSSCFSTTPQNQKTTKLRSRMYKWITLNGTRYQKDIDQPTYLGALPRQPFPMNPLFRSEPVLAESTKRLIVQRVNQENWSLKAVSADMGVDVRRVAAVVRLAAIEKRWKEQGKQLATPYAKALSRMLPQTYYDPEEPVSHEPINELHIHKLTMQQLFVPVSESREFSRKDAAAAFHRRMLSPDARSPHPELIQLQKDHLRGVDPKQSLDKFRSTTRAQEDALIAKEEKRREEEESRTARVDTGRFEFRFKDVVTDVAGKSGRGRNAIGMRYGVPFNDRKKGAVKIPTSVP